MSTYVQAGDRLPQHSTKSIAEVHHSELKMPNCWTCWLREDPRRFFKIWSFLMGSRGKWLKCQRLPCKLRISLHVTHTCSGSRALQELASRMAGVFGKLESGGCEERAGRAACSQMQADSLRRRKSIYNHKHAGRASISRAGKAEVWSLHAASNSQQEEDTARPNLRAIDEHAS